MGQQQTTTNQFLIEKLSPALHFFLFEKLFHSYVTIGEKRLAQLLFHVEFKCPIIDLQKHMLNY